MELTDLGYTGNLENFRIAQNLDSMNIGRVVAEHKERYVIVTIKGEFDAEITGNMRFTAVNRENFPAVGDWVAVTTYETNFAIIHKIFPRYSLIKRQAVGQFGEDQVIAANIDTALLLQAVDRDFNMNRLERYLTLCNSSKVNSIIVLSKADLIDEHRSAEIIETIKQRIKNIPVIAISNETQKGYEILKKYIEKGKTYCMLGSSGVGKSSLLNNLYGGTIMRTGSISQNTNRGRHITGHRELVILNSGGIIIDNPGMREVGIADSQSGLETTFNSILSLAQHCKFKNCTHTGEIGCSVFEAIENGEIDKNSYENYLKIGKEQMHFEASVADKRKKEKIFGKIIKDYYKKDIKKRNY